MRVKIVEYARETHVQIDIFDFSMTVQLWEIQNPNI